MNKKKLEIEDEVIAVRDIYSSISSKKLIINKGDILTFYGYMENKTATIGNDFGVYVYIDIRDIKFHKRG